MLCLIFWAFVVFGLFSNLLLYLAGLGDDYINHIRERTRVLEHEKELERQRNCSNM